MSSLPIINIHPRGGIFTVGDSIDLRCDVQNNNLPLLFTHNGALVNENDPGRIISFNSLSIPQFVAGFAGEYVCLARNRVGNVTFTVASAPALVQLRGMHIRTSVKFVCKCMKILILLNVLVS